jgi:hypothetical protein
MPEEGLHRAGRWHDVERYPQSAAPIVATSLTEPLLDGPRWEDSNGRFATVKLSQSAEAAIGRIFAKYQRRVFAVDEDAPSHPDVHSGIVNRVLEWFSGEPEPDYEHEPELSEGAVPADIFNRLCEIYVPYNADLRFIDISAPETLTAIDDALGGALKPLGFGGVAGINLAREPDRRLPRLILTLLHARYSSEYAGIRVCGQPDPEWESYVLWSPPERIDLAAEQNAFRYVAVWDDDAIKAAERLGVRLPEG